MKWLAGLLMCWITANAYAVDLSGVYDCRGEDAHEGEYIGTVTMKLRKEHSKGADGSYDFQLEVPDYGIYKGHAAAHGMHAAMHFALPAENREYGGKTQDFGTGIAEFKRGANGRLMFRKFYFEPAFKGGNTGVEECVRR